MLPFHTVGNVLYWYLLGTVRIKLSDCGKGWLEMRKKAVLIGVVLAAAAAGGWYYYENYYKGASAGAETVEGSVYMDRVSALSGQGSVGMQLRLIGVVEPQESKDIRLDSDKELSEVFVEVGDEVKSGDPLFSYDVEQMEQKLQEADLDLEEMANTLQTMNQQLNELTIQASKAKPSEQQAYNLEILSAQNAIHKQEYSISVKQLERAQMEKNIDNAVVYADLDGIIKSIHSDSQGENYGSGSDAFMTILATGDYRIKGTCNEMNIYSLYVGQELVIRPRADEDKIYTGIISKIETEPATDTNNNGYYSDFAAESSKYHFYVTVNEGMDLMLGQHVVMEEDTGDAQEEKTGLWIPSYYVVEEEDGCYVWSSDERQRVCRKEVTIGDRDEDMMEYQILEGLSLNDYIAFPDELVQEGMEAVLPDAPGME